MLAIPPHGNFFVKIDPTPNKKIFQKNQMYTRFMRNTTFEIVKMFLGSAQLVFKMYQIPMEHTVYHKLQFTSLDINSIAYIFCLYLFGTELYFCI